MRYAALIIVAILVATNCIGLSAQQSVDDKSAVDSVIAKLQGTWHPIDVSIQGIPSRQSAYGDSIFSGRIWTMQTTNGDHTYELSAIDAKADPIEITFTEKKQHLSFVALVKFDDDKLTITRGTKFTKDQHGKAHVLRPDSVAPDRTNLVHSFKRVSESTDVPKRPALTIRIIEDGKSKKELANHTVQSYVGGKLEFSAGGAGKTTGSREAFGRETTNPITVGTRLSGSIKDADGGLKSISIEIHLGNAVSTDEPRTTIVRSESLSLQTILRPGETKRLNCGGDRWCELLVE